MLVVQNKPRLHFAFMVPLNAFSKYAYIGLGMQIISDKAVRRISTIKGLLYFHLLPASLMQTFFFFLIGV